MDNGGEEERGRGHHSAADPVCERGSPDAADDGTDVEDKYGSR
jgi:hypothetical protein